MLPLVPSALIVVVAVVGHVVIIAVVDVSVFVDWTDLLVVGCVVTSGLTELSVIVENISLDCEPANTIKTFTISKYSPYDWQKTVMVK